MLKCSWVKFMMFITCSNYSKKMHDRQLEREGERENKTKLADLGQGYIGVHSFLLFFLTFLQLESARGVYFCQGGWCKESYLLARKKQKSFSMYLTSHLSEECAPSHSQNPLRSRHKSSDCQHCLSLPFSRSAWRG